MKKIARNGRKFYSLKYNATIISQFMIDKVLNKRISLIIIG